MENINHLEPAVIDYENTGQVDAMLFEEFLIVPTPKEFYLGKIHAYKLAANRILQEEKKRKEKERRESFTKPWTKFQMRDKAFEYGKLLGIQENFDFKIDIDNEFVFDLLCMYFSGDKEFENYGIGDIKYSLKKGIWLQSPIRGTGKSVMLRCFTFNKRCCFGYKHTTELAALFQKKGFEGIDDFIGTVSQSPSATNFYQPECGFMYDELFGETKVNHMGSPMLISEYIVNKLYDFSANKNKERWKFHCTSNADGNDIEAIAGKNYRSRMIDMFNLIKLDGSDRRIK